MSNGGFAANFVACPERPVWLDDVFKYRTRTGLRGHDMNAHVVAADDLPRANSPTRMETTRVRGKQVARMQSGSRDYPPGIRFATSGRPVVVTAKDSFCRAEKRKRLPPNVATIGNLTSDN